MWLLANDATPRAVPSCIKAEAVRLVLAARGVLILARRPEVEADMRDGLLRALNLATVGVECVACQYYANSA